LTSKIRISVLNLSYIRLHDRLGYEALAALNPISQAFCLTNDENAVELAFSVSDNAH